MVHTIARWFIPLVCLVIIAPPAQAQDEGDEEVEAIDVPNSPAGKQLQWVIDVMNGKKKFGDPTEHFSDRFLEDFKPGELEAELAKIKPEGLAGKTVEVVRVDEAESEESITAIIRGEGTRRYLSVFIALDAKTRKMAGLLFNMAVGSGGESADWDAYSGDLGKMKGSASFGAYEIVTRPDAEGVRTSRLVPVHEFGEEKVLPIGSAFKLWVLGALAEEVDAGRASWDSTLPIYDSLKSLPSGTMQSHPGGLRHTLREYAGAMIRVSDNTATDHLIARLGRERVESFMETVTDHPGVNRPMLTTRDMFALKIGGAPGLLDEYAEADEPARRALVEPGGRVFRTGPSLLSATMWTRPIAPQRVEWFASCHDLCRAMMRLRELEQRPGLAPVGEILRANPGLPYDRAVWKSVGFKGGSEPGVMNLTFLLERNDGRWFALSAGWCSETETLEEARLAELVRKGMEMLAAHE